MKYVLALGIVQALLLAFFVMMKKEYGNGIRNNLGALLLLSALSLLGRFGWEPEYLLTYAMYITLPDALLFLFGPLVLYFVQALLKHPRTPWKRKWLHFLPAFLNVAVLNSILGFALLGELNWVPKAHVTYWYGAIELGGMVSCGVYLFISHRFFKQYRQAFFEAYSAPFLLGFMRFFFFFGYALLGCWLLGFLLGRVVFLNPYFAYEAFWILMCFALYVLTYIFLKWPVLFEFPPLAPVEEEVQQEKVWDRSLESKLQEVMEREKPYVQPGLTLAELATYCSCSAHELSAVINRSAALSFADFVNSYRVEDFILTYQKRKQTDEKVTYIEVAFEVGFNSKSAFNRAFKRHKNSTPSVFFSATL